jgi:uncharacterized membrane protein (DUF373 family)
MVRQTFQDWARLRRAWADLRAYERFESVVASLLRVVIGAIIAVALYRLIVRVVDTLVLRALDPLEHSVFQQVFGAIMTLLITLEFGHTLQYVIARGAGIIQARVVVLIALLALARKIIVVDLFEFSPASVMALAALTLSLGVAYWLLREREERPQSLPVEEEKRGAADDPQRK